MKVRDSEVVDFQDQYGRKCKIRTIPPSVDEFVGCLQLSVSEGSKLILSRNQARELSKLFLNFAIRGSLK